MFVVSERAILSMIPDVKFEEERMKFGKEVAIITPDDV